MISIITVTHNSWKSLERLRASLKMHTLDYEWIIVDNASRKNGPLAELEDIEESGDAKVLRNKKNEYFTRGCNQGIEVSTGDPIVLLNPDCQVTPGWLPAMKRVLTQTAAGIVGCVLVNEMDEIVHAGGVGLGDHPGEGMPYSDEYAFTQTRKHNGWVTGACLMISRECLNAVGGKLDESRKHYYSDIQLCESARKAGYEVWVSSHVVVHSVGGSGL